MGAASLAAGDHALRRQWRYTWETLAHLPLLRLYLFRPSATALRPAPSDLRADLRLDASLLLLSFTLAGDAVSLRVPVPRVLVDPSAPPECRVAGDHLEVRLTLVLPVDHPVVAAAFPGAHPPAPLGPLRDDLKSLSSGDVHLYCKTCSTRLTRQPLRDIVEMPSLDWEDVADNWFGGCCTSFGGASEKLVSRYINAYGRLEGTTLLDATSIIIEKDYLEMDLVSTVANSVPDIDFVALQEAMSTVSLQNDCTTEKIKLNKPEDEACHRNKIGSSHVQAPRVLEETETNGRTPWTDQSGTIQLKNGGDVNSEKSKGDCFVENVKQPSLETDSSLVDPCSCCCESGDSGKTEYNTSKMPTNNWKVQTALENQRDYKLTKSISLGSSFIVKESNLLKDVDWLELLCSHCSSSLGSYPSQCSLAPSDGRVRLFKCYTSSDISVGGPHDVFRGHTLGKLFVNLLLEIAEDEISFRTVVRDLKTKTPLLQIVLLSSKAWLFSGYCYENDMDGSHGIAHLQPAVKVLYSNCSNSSEADLRAVEEWSYKYRAEQLYMMGRQINELTECLSSAMSEFPLSCSSLEGMCLSSLER
ncbi:uncharacterized protein LOC100834319 [Brachypodium distachyon]|uniref:Ubiquitin-conjugating enzyme E2C-binding protein n=1 Tax=Brachypodium distachyon TaxID=15368 RepID=A0A2K2CUU9_BRADI|nr:uncharacterized protein LOC100834319 [Brachypodium distachyon]PNT65806.1 hypothetical protein BRADI_3g02932v3 [Brachypodium distachyon]PNT65807.1 hypothetical protein BRADI_3g02932v3 [Brachypodium distachyon]PNT65808.1 hypothetical protein BRADI_3g02932v3 [Brachypodium distachyon]|eukprot:XP_003570883.1 uncharacterized protein LOC100834319 [Brachypodium distachyon]